MPAGPTSVTRRSLRRESADGSQVGVAAGHRRGERRKVADDEGVTGSRRRSGAVEDGVLEQDLVLQGPQRRTWLEPELFGERLAHTGVGAQRVGLAAAAVERGDERGPQPLAERVLTRRALRARRRPRRRHRDRASPRAGPRRARAGPPRAGHGAGRPTRRRRRRGEHHRGTSPAPWCTRRAPPPDRHRSAVAPPRRPSGARRAHRLRSGSTFSTYPARVPETSDPSPSDRRSRETFVCNGLRAMPTASSAHRSSISRSVRTMTPLRARAGRAARSSCPAAPGPTTPSRCSSTGPSTETEITPQARARPVTAP